MNTNSIGLLFDDRYLLHSIEKQSAENPERLRHLNAVVRDRYAGRYMPLSPREAVNAEIEAVHSKFYLGQLREHMASADPFSYDPDTYLMEQSLYTARLAAGGCLQLVDALMAGDIGCGYALVRPPGHHAEPGRGMGFCILNNVAIAARYLCERYDASRVLVIDLDVHHGNGTQEVFYESEKVLVVSIHQNGLFPGDGSSREIGSAAGEGYTFNIPVHSQFGDVEYTYLLGRTLQGVVESYMPQAILVSMGYDGHVDDAMSGVCLTTGWYATAAAMLRQYAAEVCDGRLLFILEGGYNREALAKSVITTLDSLFEPLISRVGVPYSERADQILQDHPLKRRWHIQ